MKPDPNIVEEFMSAVIRAWGTHLYAHKSMPKIIVQVTKDGHGSGCAFSLCDYLHRSRGEIAHKIVKELGRGTVDQGYIRF